MDYQKIREILLRHLNGRRGPEAINLTYQDVYLYEAELIIKKYKLNFRRHEKQALDQILKAIAVSRYFRESRKVKKGGKLYKYFSHITRSSLSGLQLAYLCPGLCKSKKHIEQAGNTEKFKAFLGLSKEQVERMRRTYSDSAEKYNYIFISQEDFLYLDTSLLFLVRLFLGDEAMDEIHKIIGQDEVIIRHLFSVFIQKTSNRIH